MSNTKGSPFRASQCPVTHGFTRKGMLQPVYCGQWMCAHCRKRLARDWSIRARAYMNKHSETVWYFWTFTMRGSINSKAYAYERLPKMWNAMWQYVRYQVKVDFGKSAKWTYLAFVEGQPKRNHMPHFHVISSARMQKRIKDVAAEHGFGHQAKEKGIDGHEAADYVAKYLSKGDADMPKSFRRARASQDWEKLPKRAAQKLIVPLRGEQLSEFIVRASDETGLPIEVIWAKWSKVQRRQQDAELDAEKLVR